MRSLNPTEQQLLLGLVENPGRTDRELADRLGMNRSTLASTKSQLRRKRAYHDLMLPDLHRLGFEVLMMARGSLSASVDFDVRRESWKGIHGTHAHFFTMSDAEKLVTMAYGHNLTELQSRIDLFEYHYSRGRYLDERSLRFHLFPLALTRIHANLDWANVVRRDLGLPASIPQAQRNREPLELGRRQRSLISILVDQPSASNSRVAGQTGMSRSTVARIREELLELEAMVPRRMVSPTALGFSLWVLVRFPFAPGSRIQDRRKATQTLLDQTPLIYFEKKQEGVAIFLFRDVESFHGTLNVLTRSFEAEGHLISKPTTQMFLLSNLKFARPYNYGRNLAISEKGTDHPVL